MGDGWMRVLEHPVLGPLPVTETVEIDFEGAKLKAIPGEPIAAALLAHGVYVFRHTNHGCPRGIFCAIGRCSDCLMQVDGVPNVRICVTPVRAGMKVEKQAAPEGGVTDA